MLSLSETDNTLDCRAPYSPQEACFEAIEGDSWRDAIDWMEEVSEGFRTAIKPEMKSLPFTTLGADFKAPMWERVSWPTVPSEPDMPPSVILKQENEDDVLKLKNTSNSKQENVLECSELERGAKAAAATRQSRYFTEFRFNSTNFRIHEK